MIEVSESAITQNVMEMVCLAAPKKGMEIHGGTPLSTINMDSLEKLSLAMDLEALYELKIPDEEIERFEYVSDFINCLLGYLIHGPQKIN